MTGPLPTMNRLRIAFPLTRRAYSGPHAPGTGGPLGSSRHGDRAPEFEPEDTSVVSPTPIEPRSASPPRISPIAGRVVPSSDREVLTPRQIKLLRDLVGSDTESAFPRGSSDVVFPRYRPDVGSDHLGKTMLALAEKEEEEATDEQHTIPPPSARFTLNPRLIRASVDAFVVGQEKLKRTMATAVYNHYVRIETNMPTPEYEPAMEADFRTYTKTSLPRRGPSFTHRAVRHDERDRVVLDKSNILIIGPTGSGKTLIAKTTADLLQVPFSLNDATPLTQSGYVGEDTEAVIARLLQAADFDVARAQRGIVFIDGLCSHID